MISVGRRGGNTSRVRQEMESDTGPVCARAEESQGQKKWYSWSSLCTGMEFVRCLDFLDRHCQTQIVSYL